ncbi:MAG: phenylacetate-CoA ligase [Verrucomicrobiales bacterium]|jgi:phenylacetate-CoA ligase
MASASEQLGKIQALVAEIQSSNAFYRPRLANVDVTSIEAFTSSCAFTDKGMLAADRVANAPWGTNLTYPLEAYSRFVQTSGTTGVPMAWLDTKDSWAAMLECWRTVYDNAGVIAGRDRALFAFSFGPFLGFWTAYEAASSMGILTLPSGGMSSSARLEMARRYEATVLCCTPTYALRLGEIRASLPESDRPSTVRLIIVAGEPGGSIPATRQRLENLWPDARVFDHHGLTEVGPVSYEDPEKPGRLCVIEDAYFAEILDLETGFEVTDGGRGELVLTTLSRIGCPLLRYRTGDLVQKARGSDGALALEGGILGRVDDMIVVRGVNLYPSAIEGIIRRFENVVEYQVVERTCNEMAEVTVNVEIAEGINRNSAIASIETALKNAFGLRIPVKIAEDGLPRFEFKSRRWVKEE